MKCPGEVPKIAYPCGGEEATKASKKVKWLSEAKK